MSVYSKVISEATSVKNVHELEEIEEMIRGMFSTTLDHFTKAELTRMAIEVNSIRLSPEYQEEISVA